MVRSFLKANKPDGFDCPGCAFPDRPGSFGPDSCEQGQKAIAWEMTPLKADAAFFGRHTLAELRGWSHRDIEAAGRLTEPLLFNAVTDRYEPIAWGDALQLAATHLRALEPTRVSFYTSGRSSNEAAFLWQLLARAYGSANLPDSSNLCHEPSGLAMKAQIGVGKGTATLADFEQADCILVVGQNPATNHPAPDGHPARCQQTRRHRAGAEPAGGARFRQFRRPEGPRRNDHEPRPPGGQDRLHGQDRRRPGRAQGRDEALGGAGGAGPQHL